MPKAAQPAGAEEESLPKLLPTMPRCLPALTKAAPRVFVLGWHWSAKTSEVECHWGLPFASCCSTFLICDLNGTVKVHVSAEAKQLGWAGGTGPAQDGIK